MQKKKYTSEETSERLKKANSKFIQKFLLDRIKVDEDLCQALGEFLDTPLIKKSTVKDFESTIIKAWDRAFEKVKDHWYYSYSDRDFENKLKDILKRVRKEATSLEGRASLQFKLLDNSNFVRNYDKDEVFNVILKDILGDFHEVLKISAEEEGYLMIRKLLFESCLKLLNKFKVKEDMSAMVVYLEEFVIEHFKYDFFDSIKDYIDSRIQKTLISKMDSSDRNYHIAVYVRMMLDILLENGATEDVLLSYAKNYWEIDKVRQWFAAYYRNIGKLDKVIEVLEESIGKYNCTGDLYSDYKMELKELYLQTGKIEPYCEILLEEIKRSDNVELEKFRQLKALNSAQRWTEAAEEIYTSKEGNNEILAVYFSENQEYQRLLKLILANDTTYAFFNKYAPTLPKEYSQELLSRYEDFYQSMISKAKTRMQYQELMDALEDAHQIPGGKELTQNLTSKWLKKYAGRSALCDEIEKFRSKYKTTD